MTPEEREKNRAHYLKHREKILARAKEKYKTDPTLKPRLLENWKAWAKKNPDKVYEHHRKYVNNNRDKVRVWQRKRQKKDHDASLFYPAVDVPEIRITGPVTLGEDAWA
jgi:hypothetical protein